MTGNQTGSLAVVGIYGEIEKENDLSRQEFNTVSFSAILMRSFLGEITNRWEYLRVYDSMWYYDVPHTPEERSGAIKALHQIIKWHLKMIDAKAVVSGK